MSFRDQLLATLRAVAPILDVPGVIVVGSEVPNLLEPGAASRLVVSQAVDLGVPIAAHAEVKRRLGSIDGLVPSSDEPSVWVPRAERRHELIEVNFLGIDPSISDPADTYELEDSELPLMVFGALSLLRGGPTIEVDGLRIPLSRTSGLALEKLLTDRAGEKGDRDLLVVAGLIDALPGGRVTTLAYRVKQVRTRARIRRWEYRQRHTAHGAWFRFRRALGFAEHAYVISEADAARLIEGGAPVDIGGRDLEPPRTLVWIRREQLGDVATAHPLALHLGPALLEPRWLALIAFDELGPPGPPP